LRELGLDLVEGAGGVDLAVVLEGIHARDVLQTFIAEAAMGARFFAGFRMGGIRLKSIFACIPGRRQQGRGFIEV
jgi:hypothetical protein